MTRHETPLADAWLHATGCGEPLNGLLDGRYEVDAYLLLDQEGPPCPADVDGVQLQMQGNCSGGLSSCPNDEPFSTLQSGSPYGQGDEQGSRRHGSTVASKGGSRSRKCTSLAQREAHKRYREKKKMNVSVEAAAAGLVPAHCTCNWPGDKFRCLHTVASCHVDRAFSRERLHPASGKFILRLRLPSVASSWSR
jgi:hypothetical protein